VPEWRLRNFRLGWIEENLDNAAALLRSPARRFILRADAAPL
jgi:hypothetical protein